MSDILYIPDLAARLGITDSAVRNHIKRRTKAIPPGFKLGGKWAWRIRDYENWLSAQHPVKQYEGKRRGRPRLS